MVQRLVCVFLMKSLTGSLVPVTITTEPWDNKPARAVLGAQLTGRYVILLPGNLI